MADQSFPHPTDLDQAEALAELAAAYQPRPLAPPLRIRLTEQTIARLQPREDGKQFCAWDSAMSGFGVRVSGRTKAFVIVYRCQGRSRWITVGKSPNVTLNDARTLARKLFGQVAGGADPASERQRQHQQGTFAELAARYIEEHAKRFKKPASIYEDQRYIDRELLPKWQHRRAADIRRREVIDLLESIAARPAPIAANRCLALVSKIFSFGVEREIIASSPAIKLPKPSAERQRDRVLNDTELTSIWRQLDEEDPATAAAYRLLILTAARKSEVADLRWAELNLDEAASWSLPATRAKSKRGRLIPLSTSARSILAAIRAKAPAGSESVFKAPKLDSALPRLRQAVGGESWHLHDLRRSAASGMARLGTSRLVIGKILGHAESGSVTSIYDRHDRADEMRVALERWSQHLQRLLAGETVSNVITLRAAGE